MTKRRSMIGEILKRKVEERRLDISDIVEKYGGLNKKEEVALRSYENSIDTYMEICKGAKPDREKGLYVDFRENAAFRRAMKIATIAPLIASGGLAYLFRKHLVKAAVVTVVATSISRATERKFGLITEHLKNYGPMSWAAGVNVYLSERNLRRVIENEARKK